MEALRGLGFDEVFNYKTTDVAAALDKAAPEGIDIYWVRTYGAWMYEMCPADRQDTIPRCVRRHCC